MNDALMRLIVGAYNIASVFDVLLIAYVLIEAQDDLHLKRTDTPSILKWRGRTFAAGGYFLLFLMAIQDSWLTMSSGLVAIGFISVSAAMLAVSAISLKRRAPPSENISGFHISTLSSHHMPAMMMSRKSDKRDSQ